MISPNQNHAVATDGEIKAFTSRFDHILVHFDIDVLDEHRLHKMLSGLSILTD